MNTSKKTIKFKLSNRIIMLCLVVLAVIICVIATFVTEYTTNNVSAEKAFETKIEEGWVEVSNDDFLKHFITFDLKEDKLITPLFVNGELDTPGKATISLKTEFDNEVVNKMDKKERLLNETTTLTVYAKYGADWLGFYSNEASFSNYTIGSTSPTTRTINDFNQKFPARKLLFISIENPELFGLVKWTYNNTTYYTLLTLTANEYQ